MAYTSLQQEQMQRVIDSGRFDHASPELQVIMSSLIEQGVLTQAKPSYAPKHIEQMQQIINKGRTSELSPETQLVVNNLLSTGELVDNDTTRLMQANTPEKYQRLSNEDKARFALLVETNKITPHPGLDIGMMDTLKGIGEHTINMAVDTMIQPLAGYAGMAQGTVNLMSDDPETTAESAVNKIKNWSSEPQGFGAKAISSDIANKMAPVMPYIQKTMDMYKGAVDKVALGASRPLGAPVGGLGGYTGNIQPREADPEPTMSGVLGATGMALPAAVSMFAPIPLSRQITKAIDNTSQIQKEFDFKNPTIVSEIKDNLSEAFDLKKSYDNEQFYNLLRDNNIELNANGLNDIIEVLDSYAEGANPIINNIDKQAYALVNNIKNDSAPSLFNVYHQLNAMPNKFTSPFVREMIEVIRNQLLNNTRVSGGIELSPDLKKQLQDGLSLYDKQAAGSLLLNKLQKSMEDIDIKDTSKGVKAQHIQQTIKELLTDPDIKHAVKEGHIDKSAYEALKKVYNGGSMVKALNWANNIWPRSEGASPVSAFFAIGGIGGAGAYYTGSLLTGAGAGAGVIAIDKILGRAAYHYAKTGVRDATAITTIGPNYIKAVQNYIRKHKNKPDVSEALGYLLLTRNKADLEELNDLKNVMKPGVNKEVLAKALKNTAALSGVIATLELQDLQDDVDGTK